MAKNGERTQRASIVAMSRSLQRTLRAEGKSEQTVYSYLLSARLLSEFLDDRGHDLTVDISKDDIRDFIVEGRRPRLIVDGLGRMTFGFSTAEDSFTPRRLHQPSLY